VDKVIINELVDYRVENNKEALVFKDLKTSSKLRIAAEVVKSDYGQDVLAEILSCNNNIKDCIIQGMTSQGGFEVSNIGYQILYSILDYIEHYVNEKIEFLRQDAENEFNELILARECA